MNERLLASLELSCHNASSCRGANHEHQRDCENHQTLHLHPNLPADDPGSTQATIEIDSLFEGIDYSCSLTARKRAENLVSVSLPWVMLTAQGELLFLATSFV